MRLAVYRLRVSRYGFSDLDIFFNSQRAARNAQLLGSDELVVTMS